MIDLFYMTFQNIEVLANLSTIVISVAAVVYWVKLFRRTTQFTKQDRAWLWFLASVFIVLLLNLLIQVIILAGNNMLLPEDSLLFDVSLTFVMAITRTIMALSLATGAYMMYHSMKQEGDVKFSFTPVKPQFEAESSTKQKFNIETGCSYMLIENPQDIATGKEVSMELFSDIVTHGISGFVITRKYPDKVREKYNLSVTPMLWLSFERVENAIAPSDIVRLSQVMKTFISEVERTVILFDGIEYMMLHNSFDEVFRLIVGLNDVVVQHKSILIVPLNIKSFTEQQFQLLSTELTKYSPK